MKQFLQIHNTNCNKRRIFRTILQEKIREEAQRIIGTRNTRKKRNAHLAVLEINAVLMRYYMSHSVSGTLIVTNITLISH